MTRHTSVIASPATQWIAWIERYVESQPHRFVRGKCKQAVDLMIADFPELRRAGGFVHWSIPSRDIEDQHWWCVSPDGSIVDPTAEQFASSLTKPRYEEVDPEAASTKDRIPIGHCMECGNPCFPTSHSHNHCSEECEDLTTQYYNDEMTR
jgi:hypothetical protein